MSELDNAAAGKATKAAFDHWESLEDEAHALGFSTTWEEVGGVVRECWVNSTRAAITAYLAAAARPTPDADIDPSVTIPPQRTREAMGRVVNRRNGTPSDLLDAVAAPETGTLPDRKTLHEAISLYGSSCAYYYEALYEEDRDEQGEDQLVKRVTVAARNIEHLVFGESLEPMPSVQPEPGTEGEQG